MAEQSTMAVSEAGKQDTIVGVVGRALEDSKKKLERKAYDYAMFFRLMLDQEEMACDLPELYRL